MISPSRIELRTLFFVTLLVFLWSGIAPHDRLTWALEVFPAVIAAIVLFFTYRSFPLTRLTYWLIAIHAVILMVGGHYTYEKVPLFDWIRDIFGFSRNHYDRLGHFTQGFVPAIVAREVIVRTGVLQKKGWLFFFVTSICLAISAFYELIEWCTALINNEAAAAFLGTQGDVWDTQWDMFLALLGALTAQILLKKLHIRQMGID